MSARLTSMDSSAPVDASNGPPEALPRPTYAPAAMALGITFLFWGLVTSGVVLGAGALLIIVSLAAWIREMRHEP